MAELTNTSDVPFEMVIQAVRFDKKLFSLNKAIKVLNEFRLTPLKAFDDSKNQLRARIIDPKWFNVKTFRTFRHPSLAGVSFIMGKLLEGDLTKRVSAKTGQRARKSRVAEPFAGLFS